MKPFSRGGYRVTAPRDPRVICPDRAAQLRDQWRALRAAWSESQPVAQLSPRDLYRLEKARRGMAA